MGRKIWKVASYDKKRACALAAECGTDDFAVLLLQSRGIDTPEKVCEFLSSEEPVLSSPFLMKDMDKACDRIHRAIENGEKILVYGDYDADGVTATAVLYSYLETVGADASWYIPSRLHEGYGLSEGVAEKIASMDVNLVITVDNGISAIPEAEFFASKNIDLIVTDHHKAGKALPRCCAVVDPHREDDVSGFRELAGVGVALKLTAALEGGDYNIVLEDYADIAALGTIADIVPLTGENRMIVKAGLKALNQCDRPGLCALMESLSLGGKNITSTNVAFGLAPRINAAGRMDSAGAALKLLLTEDAEEANELSAQINRANTERQTVENEIIAQTEAYFDENPARRTDRVIVAAGKGWHSGVIGIVASRLVEKYGRPAFVLSCDDSGVARGSGRSIEGFSLYEALSSISDDLIQFGGHTLAAGFSVETDKIELFRRRINECAMLAGDIFPVMHIDCRLNPANITAEILDSLAFLEPFGAENPVPVFGLFNMNVRSVKPIGSTRQHIRVTLSRDETVIGAVWFGMNAESFPYSEGDAVDIAVRTEKNVYLGETRLSIQIKDMRPAGSDDTGLFKSRAAYDKFRRNETLADDESSLLCPDRGLLAAVYKYIKSVKKWKYDTEILCAKIGIGSEYAGAVGICLDALCAVGILSCDCGIYTLNEFKGKADLSGCDILKRLGYKA